jgi:hypothetical protein
MADDVAITFGALNGRLQTLVEGLIASGKDPNDPTAGLYISGAKAADYAESADASPLDRRLALAAERLGLDVLETAVLALCAAPQLDPRYAPVYAFLHDDVTRKLPSPRLVADVLDGERIRRGDVLGCFRAEGRLRRLGCIELAEDAQRPFIEQAIKLAPPLASFLLDVAIEERGRDWRVRTMTPPDHDIGRAATIERIGSLLRQPAGLPLLIAGPDAPALLAAALGGPLLLADARFVDDVALRRHAALLCALEGLRLAWEGLDDLDPEQGRRIARVLAGSREQDLLCARSTHAAVLLGEAPAIVVEVPEPTLAERRAVWRTLSGTPESDDVAAKFRLSVGQVEVAAEIARTEAAADGRDAPAAGDLAAGARLASSSRLGQLAARVPPAYEWRDLVLPERLLRMLRSISGYLRHRDQVLSEWGYGRRVAPSQGLKVLFAGDSGTGKTMAAQVLANDLGLELFRVDLATIVSKYIGETEKNLDRIFGAAEGSNAILFFDEADALFGKRSEVSDSHDRYANIEVAYLLQKMEGYAGAVILATNFKKNLDDAFVRRLDFAVDFPFPDTGDRRRIWQLVLPDEAPIAGDLDLDFLATQFKLSGGAIRNCSLAAAFEAAAADVPIGMEQLVRAVAVEYGKQGRLTLEADFGRFHPLLRGDEPAAPEPEEPEPEPPAAPPPPSPPRVPDGARMTRGAWLLEEKRG